MLEKQVEELYQHVQSQGPLLAHNEDLFCIYEGELLSFIEAELKNQLSLQSYEIAKSRIPPINLLTKLIDKLSKIYQQDPMRYALHGTEADKELLHWYEHSMDMNVVMNSSNEFFNLFKNNLIQPYVYKGMPRLRSLSSNMFTVYSESEVDPTEPTHVITFHENKRKDGSIEKLYYVYTDDEFMIFDTDQKIRRDIMSMIGNPDGVNVAGKIPFVYVNRSKNLLIPKIDTDVKKMVILAPVLLSDINFSVMMQAFSIMYGIDIDDQGIKMAPNAFWSFKSDPSTETTPSLGVLKPQVDIQPTMELIQAEIGLWLQTKGIKPGAVGTLTSENFASGISKMIDEMDTSEERQKQVGIYKSVESKIWNLITNHMHPTWKAQGAIDQPLEFHPDVKIVTDFSEQLPMLNRGDIVRDLQSEVMAGFTSKRRAIKKLNPRMSEDQIDELLAEIQEDQINEESEPEPMEK